MKENGLSRKGAPRRPKILFISHNHPSVRPGGAEAYALELHRHLIGSERYEPTFLAHGGPPLSVAEHPHLGTLVTPVDRHPNEYFFYTDDWNAQYDWTFGTFRDSKEMFTKHLRAFLRALSPDLVHLHHTMFFGYDVLREIKNSVPDAPIVFTLHEFMPICHRQGQMLRVTDGTPCMEESPRRCNECFPEISPQTFFMRKRFIQSHLSLVDRFIAPSAFLGDRYIDWGIPREKLIVEEYGRTPPAGEALDEQRERRDRFGFFGQLTQFKGVNLLLEAMALVNAEPHLDDPLLRALERAAGSAPGNAAQLPGPIAQARVHGANLDLQPGNFQQRVEELLEQTRSSVTFVGRYDHDDLARHIAKVDWVVVPSIWWENSPLVIQEAFHFRRPVICSDIGGMAEKVTDGVDGLHFRANDAASLATTIERAATEPGLWESLRAGINPIYPMARHVEALMSVYDELLTREAIHHAC